METISRFLVTFLLNAVWQIPLVAAVAWLACRLLRRSPAAHLHAIWVAALLAAIVLPVASLRPVHPAPAPQITVSLPEPGLAPAAAPLATAKAAGSSRRARTVAFTPRAGTLLLAGYMLFVCFRL